MKLAISVGILFSLLCMITGEQEHVNFHNEMVDNTTLLQWKAMAATVSCSCNERILQEKIPIDADAKDMDVFEYCGNNTPFCEHSKKCDNCTLEIKKCRIISERENTYPHCIYKRMKIRRPLPKTKIGKLKSLEDHQGLKTKITGPFRHRRDLHSSDCPFPSEMKTAELKCHIYAKYVKCRQICLFGYTLQEGISKEMTCYYQNNKWSGYGFRECVPFVDCTVTLTTGGEISCEKNTMRRAPHCNVSCAAYEDKPATPMQMYTCTLEPDKWKPDLPHCVIPGSGFILAPPPRIRDHSKEILEPEEKRKKPQSKKLTEPDVQKRDAVEEEWG